MKTVYTQAIAVDPNFKYTLLIKRENKPGKGLLSGVGGHMERGETPEQCMRREWEEEVGSSIPNDAKLIFLTTIESPDSINHNFGVILPSVNPYWSVSTVEGPISWYHIIGWHIMDVNNPDVAWDGVIPYMINVLKDTNDGITSDDQEEVVTSNDGTFNIKKELQLDLDGEDVAIEQYESHIEQIDDKNVTAVLKEILGDEKDHKDKLSSLLKALKGLVVKAVHDDKWITTSPEKGDGKHILLDDQGNIVGGSVPKSAQGQNIKEWAKSQKESSNKNFNSNKATTAPAGKGAFKQSDWKSGPEEYEDPVAKESAKYGVDYNDYWGTTYFEKGIISVDAIKDLKGFSGEEHKFDESGGFGKYGKDNWNKFLADIKENGIKTPVEIAIKPDGKKSIINGNHRLQAAKQLGIKDVPIIVRYLDGAEKSTSKESTNSNKENLGEGPVTEKEVEKFSTSGYKDDPAGYISYITGWDEAKSNEFFRVLYQEWTPGHTTQQVRDNPEKMGMINEYMDSAKPWDGSILYRGVKIDPATVDNYQVGQSINHSKLSSWTPRQQSAESYAREGAGSGKISGQSVIFEVSGIKQGATDINYITGQRHREVLCNPKASTFKIVSIDRSDPSRTVIHGESLKDPNVKDSVMDNKWITTKPETGKGKRILLDDQGNIIGGSIPKSAQGMNIREWGKSVSKEARQKDKANKTKANTPPKIDNTEKISTAQVAINNHIKSYGTVSSMQEIQKELEKRLSSSKLSDTVRDLLTKRSKYLDRKIKEQTNLTQDLADIKNNKVNSPTKEPEKITKVESLPTENPKVQPEQWTKEDEKDNANPRGKQIQEIRKLIRTDYSKSSSLVERNVNIGKAVSDEVENRLKERLNVTTTLQAKLATITDKYSYSDIMLPENSSIKSEYEQLNKEIVKSKKGIQARQQEAVKNVINELVGNGNPVKISTKSTKLAKLMNEASSVFPKDWVNKLNNRPIRIHVSEGKRGYYRDATGDLVLSGGSDKSQSSTASHELMHSFEHTMPELRKAASEFLNKRTANEHSKTLKSLTHLNYDDSEVAKKDHFTSPYIGKIYSNGATEVLSMGIQGVLYNEHNLKKKDPEHYNLILGLLVGGAK